MLETILGLNQDPLISSYSLKFLNTVQAGTGALGSCAEHVDSTPVVPAGAGITRLWYMRDNRNPISIRADK